MSTTTASPNNARVKFKGKPMKEKSAGLASPTSERDYEAESALDTMQRAEEHQSNPDMMKRVVKHAQKKATGLDAVMAKLRARGLVSDKQAAKAERKRAAK